MRNTKKAISILLTLLMVVGMMSAFAFAATGNSSITINNTTAGQEYTIYKIFNVTKSGDNAAYSMSEAMYKIWGEAINTVVPGTIVKSGTNYRVNTEKLVTEDTDGKDVIKPAIVTALKNVTNKGTAVAGPTAAAGTSITFNGLDAGYYYIDTTLGALCLLGNSDSEEIVEKNGTPVIEKTVDGKKYESVAIGDTVSFKLEVTPGGEAKQAYTIHDNMSAGLTNPTNFKVQLNNGEATPIGQVSGYTLNLAPANNHCSFEIEISDTVTSALAKTDKVIITYDVTVTADVVQTLDPATNKVKLTFGNSSYDSDTDVKLFTATINIFKYTGNKTPLADAWFAVKNSDDKYLIAKKNGSIIEKYDWANVKFTDEGVGTITDTDKTGYEVVIVKTGADGTAKVEGLAAGTYKLTEVKAPEGYNKLVQDIAPITITVDSSTTNDINLEPIQIENTTGSQLPETGGIGTTIFYILGAILVIGAGVVFVTRRRMHSEK